MDLRQKHKISITGLGYVGLPVAVAFGKAGYTVVAYDINAVRITELRKGYDRTSEVKSEDLQKSGLLFSDSLADLSICDFHIVTVPTPIDDVNRPDMRPLINASKSLGSVIKRDDIVIYESTVYPGATEEVCVPILERGSGLKYGTDFTVGYSPERINPGDKIHRFESIQKVVSGSDSKTLETVANVYASVVSAGVHKAPTLATAEAAKVIENVQRDLNIALINEIALICHRLGIDTNDVLEAAGTKWNFMKFYPGLVGGHCIGVDPYYLTHCAEKAGYHPEIILSGRRTNAEMPYFVVSEVVKSLFRSEDKNPIVTILGCTFKEDLPDIRNSRVSEIVKEFKSYNLEIQLCDPYANREEVLKELSVELMPLDNLKPASVVILAVAHKPYVKGGWKMISNLLKNERSGVVFDLKSILEREKTPLGVKLWRL